MNPEQDEKEMLKYRRFLTECAENMILDHRTAIQKRKHDNFFSKLSNEKKDDKKL